MIFGSKYFHFLMPSTNADSSTTPKICSVVSVFYAHPYFVTFRQWMKSCSKSGKKRTVESEYVRCYKNCLKAVPTRLNYVFRVCK